MLGALENLVSTPGSSFVNLERSYGQEAIGIAEEPPTATDGITGFVSDWLLFLLPERALQRELEGQLCVYEENIPSRRSFSVPVFSLSQWT